MTVSHLRCEYLVDPLGIDETSPRLSWEIESSRRGARQKAYRIVVEPGLWDTGLVESDETAHIVYCGKPLISRQVCTWHVEVWDEQGNLARSEPSVWSMGLLKPADWKAKWIAVDPEIIRRDPQAIAPTWTEPGTPGVFRREFQAHSPIRRATLYATARGLFDLQINRKRVGEDIFAPEWTDYDKRIQYRTYDVTSLLMKGENRIDATLGDGWWSGYVGWQETRARYGTLENSLLVQLEIESEDGQRMDVRSDGSWQCNTGPIISSDFIIGEVYDARREQSPYAWLPAREVAPPTVPLVAQRGEPVRITELLKPISMKEVSPGKFIFDLGQNMAGWVRLKLAAPAGTKVVLRHGEALNPDGMLYTENLRRAKATDTYFCKGSGEEIWQPRFTFHGFQFVELTGLAAPTIDSVTGCVIHSSTPPAGRFECSHAGVNRLWLNGHWSQRDNFLSVPTDCPQRDERLGWMGDAQVFLRTATYNMDVAAFFSKWMIDVEDAQTSDGIFPDIAPRLREGKNFIGLGGLCGSAGWADAGIIVPWTIWRVYGDTRIIERHFAAMTRWLDYLQRTNPDGFRRNALGNNYGDWLCIPSDTSFGTHSPMKNLLATAYWADDAAKLAEMATAIGRDSDAKRFDAMFEHVRAAFQKEFLREDGRLTVETQTAYLLALSMNLLPENVRARAAERLVENIRNLNWHLSTGFIGISHLNPTLTLCGRPDVAYRLLLRDDYPSWLYPIRHGATTIWERWNGWTEEKGFFNPSMNSFNHYSLGSVGEWLFRHVAGIEQNPIRPGFKRFLLRPFAGSQLSFVRASYHSVRGEIRSEWKCSGNVFDWQIRVPANTEARVWIPSELDTPVTESGKSIEHVPEVKVAGREGRSLVCDVPGGSYSFQSMFRA